MLCATNRLVEGYQCALVSMGSRNVYGGTAHWIPLFERVHSGSELGHCFPGGHASDRDTLIAGYFALRLHQARWTRWMLILGLTLGKVMRTVQIVRGAHFLSHNL